jgi:hypothetical protein
MSLTFLLRKAKRMNCSLSLFFSICFVSCSRLHRVFIDAEASAILKRLTERLYQYNNLEQQADIDSLQDILNSPLFHTLYNLQASFRQLKSEYEEGNSLVQNCLFDFDINGYLRLINEKTTNPSKTLKKIQEKKKKRRVDLF